MRPIFQVAPRPGGSLGGPGQGAVHQHVSLKIAATLRRAAYFLSRATPWGFPWRPGSRRCPSTRFVEDRCFVQVYGLFSKPGHARGVRRRALVKALSMNTFFFDMYGKRLKISEQYRKAWKQIRTHNTAHGRASDDLEDCQTISEILPKI